MSPQLVQEILELEIGDSGWRDQLELPEHQAFGCAAVPVSPLTKRYPYDGQYPEAAPSDLERCAREPEH